MGAVGTLERLLIGGVASGMFAIERRERKMSRIRVLMLAVIVGMVMMPTPVTVWAGEQGQKREKKQETKKEGEKGKQEKRKTDREAESTPEENGKREEKVSICHRPGGKPENAQTITVGASAVEKHLAHGDSRGPCQ